MKNNGTATNLMGNKNESKVQSIWRYSKNNSIFTKLLPFLLVIVLCSNQEESASGHPILLPL